MKLYATVTSERASKGQGGKFLNIIISDEHKNPAYRLYATEHNGEIRLKIDNELTLERVEMTTKAKKKKGDIWDYMGKEFPNGFIK